MNKFKSVLMILSIFAFAAGLISCATVLPDSGNSLSAWQSDLQSDDHIDFQSETISQSDSQSYSQSDSFSGDQIDSQSETISQSDSQGYSQSDSFSGDQIDSQSETISQSDSQSYSQSDSQTDSQSEHSHEAGRVECGATSHYYICSECGETFGEEPHEYESGICKICGYDSNVYDVIFYSDDGQTILSKQRVLSGREFVLPADFGDRNIMGFYKWDGSAWEITLISLSEFENPDLKKVASDMKFKAEFEIPPVTVFSDVEYTTVIRNKENIYGGDPSVTYKDGYYYYTFFDSYQRLFVLKSPSLEQLLEGGYNGWGHGNAVCVYDPTDVSSSNYNSALKKKVWAPELQYIDGKWYIYVSGCSSSSSGASTDERMFVLECESQDPTGRWKTPVQLCPSGFSGRYAIDGHAFIYNERLYYAFSGQKSTDLRPWVYICSMSSPTSVNNDAVKISKGSTLEEGPCTVVDGNDLYLIYSRGNYSGDEAENKDYHLEYYKLTGGTNPLNAAQWTAMGTCLKQDKSKGIYCTGHNHIFKDREGGWWTSYHAIVGAENLGDTSKRIVMVQPISVKNGSLDFGGVQDTVVVTERSGLKKSDDNGATEYMVDGEGSGRIWKNRGESFSVSATIKRDHGSDQFCAGVTLYQRNGDGTMSKLLIGVEQEGNIFFCNYYSRRPYFYKYVGWQWSNESVINLKVTYAAETKTISIKVSDANDTRSITRFYALSEINALVSDIPGGEAAGRAFDLHFTGDFEIGLGGNLNKCFFSNVVFDLNKEIVVDWNDDWGDGWNP